MERRFVEYLIRSFQAKYFLSNSALTTVRSSLDSSVLDEIPDDFSDIRDFLLPFFDLGFDSTFANNGNIVRIGANWRFWGFK